MPVRNVYARSLLVKHGGGGGAGNKKAPAAGLF